MEKWIADGETKTLKNQRNTASNTKISDEQLRT